MGAGAHEGSLAKVDINQSGEQRLSMKRGKWEEWGFPVIEIFQGPLLVKYIGFETGTEIEI